VRGVILMAMADEGSGTEVAREHPTARLFLLGAGFSKPAGLPLAGELLDLVLHVARSHFRADASSHLERAVDAYLSFLSDVDPDREFDIEEFGAWLDWEHVLRLKGSDTFSDHGNEAGLQLRWAIGKVLHERTPSDVPEVYRRFAEALTTSDQVLTLNYDLLLERALTAVGLPFRRFPTRYSDVREFGATVDVDQPDELRLHKLHGSLDWTYWYDEEHDSKLGLAPLVEGPRFEDDPLLRVAVIPADRLDTYYTSRGAWFRHPPLLMPPSRAKPLASSELIPLWDGVGLYSYMLGGFTVIGCSLPPGDPYVLQLVHHVATDYVAGRIAGGRLWPQRRL
jgi:hypothetical protein